MASTVSVDQLWEVVGAVPDPEMPPLTIADLGILRSVDQEDDIVVVTITPTYSGCPAIEYIESQIVDSLVAVGRNREQIRVQRALAPAWSTDDITAQGRAKLAASGISPPRPASCAADSEPETRVHIATSIRAICCPQCGSARTEEISRFSSTACKSLHRCLDCAEPFDHVKEL